MAVEPGGDAASMTATGAVCSIGWQNEAGSDGEFSDRSWRFGATAVSVAVLASSCLSRPVSLS
jgi:hypothetical protein